MEMLLRFVNTHLEVAAVRPVNEAQGANGDISRWMPIRDGEWRDTYSPRGRGMSWFTIRNRDDAEEADRMVFAPIRRPRPRHLRASRSPPVAIAGPFLFNTGGGVESEACGDLCETGFWSVRRHGTRKRMSDHA